MSYIYVMALVWESVKCDLNVFT